MRAALARGQFTLAEIAADALADPTLQELAARVRHAEDPRSRYPQYYSGGLVVRTHDGRELEHHIAVNRGADTNPMSEDDILDKYNRNAAPAVGANHAERIADIVLCLDSAPNLDELADALANVPATDDAGSA